MIEHGEPQWPQNLIGIERSRHHLGRDRNAAAERNRDRPSELRIDEFARDSDRIDQPSQVQKLCKQNVGPGITRGGESNQLGKPRLQWRMLGGVKKKRRAPIDLLSQIFRRCRKEHRCVCDREYKYERKEPYACIVEVLSAAPQTCASCSNAALRGGLLSHCRWDKRGRFIGSLQHCPSPVIG